MLVTETTGFEYLCVDDFIYNKFNRLNVGSSINTV